MGWISVRFEHCGTHYPTPESSYQFPLQLAVSSRSQVHADLGEPLAADGAAAAAAAAGPAPAEPPHARDFRGNPSWPVPGGWIVHNMLANSLDAHCACDHHRVKSNPCRLNRTTQPDARRPHSARGRPLGLLLAWLRAGPSKPDRERHHKMLNSKVRQPGDLEELSLPNRQAGRQWLVDHGFQDLLDLERPRLDGEPPEPEGLA